MKNKILLLSTIALLGLASCGDNTSSESSDSNVDNSTTSASSSSHRGPGGDGGHGGSGGPGGGGGGDASSSYSGSVASSSLSSTSIDGLSSGTVSLTWSGTTKTINAAYVVNGTNVTLTSGEYASASSSSDEVVFLVVNGGTLTITGTESSPVSITKSGSAASNGQVSDDYNFYGINSAIVVYGEGSSATISHANISTSSNGSNAVVATMNGSVTISDSTITTTGSAGSRGLHATYNGEISASDTSITTSGASCASLATDRGGGTVTASGMTLTTNGKGSPLVYSTGTITVSESTGIANGSQMVVVEGGSTATINSSDFKAIGTGNRSGTSESSSSSHTVDSAGIFIYQSMSGDSSSGTDYFNANNSTFEVTSSVPMFYFTNITGKVTLSGNTFNQYSSSDYFIMCEETSAWGSTGSNGGKASFSLTNQNFGDYTAFVGTSSSSLSISATDSSTTDISKTTGTWNS